jgi:hypothetical protein
VAARFDDTPAGLQSLVRDFRAGKLDLFPRRRPGPKQAPAKDAARAGVVELRLAGHSIDEISAALMHEGTPLNRTGVSELIAEAGLPRIWRRPSHERGPVRREQLPRAKVLDFAQLSAVSPTRVAGLLLAIPDLLALDLPGLIRKAGYPSTRQIPRSARSLRCWPQAHRHPADLPRRGPGRRPGCRPVRRAGHPAQEELADRLLLPA